MVTETVQAPRALCLDTTLQYGNGEPILFRDARRGDWINLSTTECRVARVMDGIRYDTDRADLVLSQSVFEYGCFSMRRIYRGHDRRWFKVGLTYDLECPPRRYVTVDGLTDDEVLPLLRNALANDGAAAQLLRDWYLCGWMPRDDAFVQAWAEATLSADDCESITEWFEAIPDEPYAHHPVTPF